MANSSMWTYYFEINDGFLAKSEFPSKYVRMTVVGRISWAANNYMQHADRVWRQGPKGGVKIVKDRFYSRYHYGYVTTDEKAMKEFMWIKLRSEEVK